MFCAFTPSQCLQKEKSGASGSTGSRVSGGGLKLRDEKFHFMAVGFSFFK
jgi:hypothetical protein